MKKLFSFILLLVLCSISAYSLEYFVASNGNDAAKGSFAEPWHTIQFAADKLTPGDTLTIRGGIYRQMFDITQSGTTERWLTIRSYKDENVRIWFSVDLSEAGSWKQISNNLWCTEDGSFSEKINYDVATIWYDDQSHWSHKKRAVNELEKQWDFYHNKDRGRIEIYSTENPASLAAHIEVPRSPPEAPYQFVTHIKGSYVLMDGLNFKYLNVHGLKLHPGAHHFIFRNGSISHGGGANINPYYHPEVRWGDCVDITGDAHHIWFENSVFGEYVDGTITNQGYSGRQSYLYFRNNYIYKSCCGIHTWLGKPGGENEGVGMDHIYYEGNTFENIGQGWFEGRAVMLGGIQFIPRENVETEDIYMRNNLFLDCGDATYHGQNWRGVNCPVNIGGGKVFVEGNLIVGSTTAGVFVRKVHQSFRGEIRKNEIQDCLWSGIHLWKGATSDPVRISKNLIIDCGKENELPVQIMDGNEQVVLDSNIFIDDLQVSGYFEDATLLNKGHELKISISEGSSEKPFLLKLLLAYDEQSTMPHLLIRDTSGQIVRSMLVTTPPGSLILFDGNDAYTKPLKGTFNIELF